MQICSFCGFPDIQPSTGCAMQCHPAGDLAWRIALSIERDLLDRRGIKQAIHSCDDEVRAEMRKKWAQIIRRKIREAR